MYGLLGAAVSFLVIAALMVWLLSSFTGILILVWFIFAGVTLYRYTRKKVRNGEW